MLATRADVEALVSGDGSSRLAVGWREELVGAPLRRLLAGDAAVAFEPGGRLVLEHRTRSPLDEDPDRHGEGHDADSPRS